MSKNKENQKEYSRKHYLLNKDKMKKRASKFKIEARQKSKEYVYEFLLKNPCIDCGEGDPIVLEFDHVRGKKRGNIPYLINMGCCIETVKKEIDKCEVRCANCHRRKTSKQFGWINKTQFKKNTN